MLVRHTFHQVFTYLKEAKYASSDVEWLVEVLARIFGDDNTAQGILLQISDVFLPELNKVDGPDLDMDMIAKLIQPLLNTLAKSESSLLKERIREQVFSPLLESNVTLPDSSDEESTEEDLSQVDGGKMSRRTRKEVLELVNTKYVFPNFNILIYAENYIFPLASAKTLPNSEELLAEHNREGLYDLYYKALKLEPVPKHPELTFSQR